MVMGFLMKCGFLSHFENAVIYRYILKHTDIFSKNTSRQIIKSSGDSILNCTIVVTWTAVWAFSVLKNTRRKKLTCAHKTIKFNTSV